MPHAPAAVSSVTTTLMARIFTALETARKERPPDEIFATLRHRQHGLLLPRAQSRHGDEDRRRIFIRENRGAAFRAAGGGGGPRQASGPPPRA